MTDSLNRVSYAGLDFDTTEDEIRARLQVKFAASFNDFSVSSLGIVLLDYVSFGLDTLSFYLDRRATDTYASTARTRKSTALVTRQLGYKMYGAVSSSVDVSIAVKVAYPFDVPIPKGYQLKTTAGIIYEVAQAVTIPANSLSSVLVPCYQGQTVSETFVSDGTKNQVFQLGKVPVGASLAQGSVTCTVNGAPFVESDLLEYGGTDQFEIGYNDSPPTLRMGDGVAGNIPVKNGSIVLTYLGTLGVEGEAISGAITSVVAPLVVSFQSIQLVISNFAGSIGGSDLEDLSHAKAFAPKVFKSRKVAVTRADYEAVSGSYVDPAFGRVAAAQAISARSYTSDTELQGLLSDLNANVTSASAAISTALIDTTVGAVPNNAKAAACLSSVGVDLATLLGKLNTIYNDLTTSLVAARTTKADAAEQSAHYTDAHVDVLTAKGNVTTLRNAVATLPLSSTSQLTTADQTTYLALIDGFTASLSQIDSILTLINSLATTMGGLADQIAGQIQTDQGFLSKDIGLDTTSPTNISGDMQAQVTNGTTATTTASTQLQVILTQASLGSSVVTTDTAAIQDHVDKILSADCKANVVVVPILSRDSSGFYASPSTGLIKSLQSFLDGIKDVTHSVSVTSGVRSLIPACLKIRLGIKVGLSEQVVVATAQTLIDGVLRNRDFGTSLYVSDLLEPLQTITGLVFVNVKINGYRPPGGPTILTTKSDSDGNLIVNANEVITLSQPDLTITTEVVTTAS